MDEAGAGFRHRAGSRSRLGRGRRAACPTWEVACAAARRTWWQA